MGLSRGAQRDRQGAREPWEPRRRHRPCGPGLARRPPRGDPFSVLVPAPVPSVGSSLGPAELRPWQGRGELQG